MSPREHAYIQTHNLSTLPETPYLSSTLPLIHLPPSFTTNYVPSNAVCPGIKNDIWHNSGPFFPTYSSVIRGSNPAYEEGWNNNFQYIFPHPQFFSSIDFIILVSISLVHLVSLSLSFISLPLILSCHLVLFHPIFLPSYSPSLVLSSSLLFPFISDLHFLHLSLSSLPSISLLGP